MKKLSIFLTILALTLTLASCASVKLADAFDKDSVIARAEGVIESANALDYSAVIAELRDDLKNSFTAEQLKDAWDSILTGAGAFEEYTGTTVIGQKDPSTGEDYAVAVITCKYEKSTLTFTLSFDKDLNVVGLYLK